MIRDSDDADDVIREYLRDSPVVLESGMDRVGELMERCHVSKRGAQVMIDHGQDEV